MRRRTLLRPRCPSALRRPRGLGRAGRPSRSRRRWSRPQRRKARSPTTRRWTSRVAEPMAKAFEAKYPGIKVAVERTGAERAVQPHRPGDGQQHPPLSTWSTAPMPRTSSPGSARAGWRRYVTDEMARERAGRHARSRRHLLQPAHASQRHRLQYQLVTPEDAPKGFMRPARSQIRRQAGQGPSRLLRHHHDRHPADRRASWAGATSRSSPSRRCCRSSRRPSRPRSSRPASAPIAVDGSDYLFWMAKERGAPIEVVLCGRGHAADQQPDGRLQGGAQSQRRAAAGRAGSCRPRARSSSST